MENQHENEKEKKVRKMENQLLEDKEEDMFSKLPMDVSLDIFARLPLSTISNCKWVSKTWYSSILHPRLVEIHFDRFRDSLPCAIFHSRYHGTTVIDPECLRNYQTTATAYHFHLKAFNENFSNSGDSYDSICFDVVGTVNGMICFSPERRDYHPAPYYICNPITKDYLLLPESPKIDVKDVGSGFGFDSVNNEYKVVRMLINSSRDGNEAEIYTLRSGMWRRIQMKVPFIEWMFNQSHVCLNGCLHWTPSVNIDSSCHTAILSFDLTSEEFNLIPMPPVKVTQNTFRFFYLIVLGDSLCVIDVGALDGGREIWVMKEYGIHNSWVKQYVFEDEFILRGWQGFHEVLELKNNQLLLLDKEGVPTYFDYKNKTSEQIELHDLNKSPIGWETKYPIYFQASLFSPKAIEGDQQGSVTRRSM